MRPKYHVPYMVAVGRRIRRHYLWILLLQSLAFAGKIAVHPTAVQSWEDAFRRADVGPLPGEVIIGFGAVYMISWVFLAIWSDHNDARRARARKTDSAMG
jgi:uncharacterized membrane protein